MEPETVLYRKTNSRYYDDNSSLEQDFPCCLIELALSLTVLYGNKKKDVHFETDCGFQLIAS